MERAISETDRRRKIQKEFNEKHGITPTTIRKALQKELVEGEKYQPSSGVMVIAEDASLREVADIIIDLEADMHLAAKNLEFERAAELRDRIKELREQHSL
jgi:excinuclease ABC subunit B